MAETFPDETRLHGGRCRCADLRRVGRHGQRHGPGAGRGRLEPGDRVGIHLHPESALRWLVSYTAAHRAGGVAVPMNPRLAPAEVGHMLAHSGATAVVADGALVATALGAAASSLTLVVDATPGATAALVGARDQLGRHHRGRPRRYAGAAGRGRPGRHPLHLGDDGPAQGRGHPSLQRFHDRRRPALVERRRVVCTPAPCSPSPASRSSTPHEARAARDLPAEVRRRSLAQGGGEGAPGGRLPGPGHGPSPARPPRLRHGRPQLGLHVLGGERAAGAVRGRAVAGADARRRWCRTTTA